VPIPRSLVGKAQPRPRQVTPKIYLHSLKGKCLKVEKRRKSRTQNRFGLGGVKIEKLIYQVWTPDREHSKVLTSKRENTVLKLSC
jgi:hypothetical protein